MINILEDYIWRSVPDEDFQTNPNLENKVDREGNILPYKGNTVVFLLDEDTKQALRNIQEELYQAVPHMLAEMLGEDTFHMTLHSLADGNPEEEWLENWMAETAWKAGEILASWQDDRPLRMKTTWTFNMVHTSIVLGLMPADENSWSRLDEIYCRLQEARPLGDLCPHITMAYFRPGVYSREDVARLREVLRPVEMEITLQRKHLVIQNFTDMNHYETV